MTLRTDLDALLAEAGLIDVDVDEALEDEHVRTSAYLRVVQVAAASHGRDQDRALVATILRDPYENGSRTAVVALVDAIARKMTGPAEFREWADGLLPEIERFEGEGHREFIRRRVDDWLFRLSVEDGHVPTAAELAPVTNWMQRLLAEHSTSAPLLALLAGSGRTRKIRNIAKNRARVTPCACTPSSTTRRITSA
ncbi:hypothetical protein [Streptomyces sp. NPDC048172]|uniref:hypothetical protein n=1 Tax=Streptomyces sp. NPDC048172 TaxID=3365505 RepID=UPI003715E053